jgi:hypothetical protein
MWQYNLTVHIGGHTKLDEEEKLLTAPFESRRGTDNFYFDLQYHCQFLRINVETVP